jgi:site-specific DNA-methyltransferase (adenine-specific)
MAKGEWMTPYYDDGQVTIYHGDCRDVLTDLTNVDADLVLVDPPYGVGFEYGTGYEDDPGTYGSFIWNIMRAAEQSLKNTGNVVCFQSATHARRWVDWFPRDWRPIALPKTFVQMRPTMMQWATDYALWWQMPDADKSDHPDWRTGVARDWFLSTSVGIGRSALLKGHPCPRPIDTMRYLVSCLCPPDGLIIDPFMGAGSTLRAAKDLGRRAIGIEIEERYCEIAVKYLAQGVLPLAS